ncbi:MAG: hypothetical protein PHS37_06685 [Candidatus Omnitrophica bacterium]|nr:hypothetical protein [Candidatus Omnitrophota bacterium]
MKGTLVEGMFFFLAVCFFTDTAYPDERLTSIITVFVKPVLSCEYGGEGMMSNGNMWLNYRTQDKTPAKLYTVTAEI